MKVVWVLQIARAESSANAFSDDDVSSIGEVWASYRLEGHRSPKIIKKCKHLANSGLDVFGRAREVRGVNARVDVRLALGIEVRAAICTREIVSMALVYPQLQVRVKMNCAAMKTSFFLGLRVSDAIQERVTPAWHRSEMVPQESSARNVISS
jgi:hypothetical protein